MFSAKHQDPGADDIYLLKVSVLRLYLMEHLRVFIHPPICSSIIAFDSPRQWLKHLHRLSTHISTKRNKRCDGVPIRFVMPCQQPLNQIFRICLIRSEAKDDIGPPRDSLFTAIRVTPGGTPPFASEESYFYVRRTLKIPNRIDAS